MNVSGLGFGLACAVCLVGAGVTQAQVTNFRIVAVDNDRGGPDLDGFITCDIVIDFVGQYTGSQLLLELDTGSIYRHPEGSPIGVPVDPSFFTPFPALEFDTGLAPGSGSPGAGAVDLGGDPTKSFPAPTTSAPTTINQAWNLSPGGLAADQTGFRTFRFTISDDASGSLRYLASANAEVSVFEAVIDGNIHIPEPTSLALLGLAGLVAAGRRGRRTS